VHFRLCNREDEQFLLLPFRFIVTMPAAGKDNASTKQNAATMYQISRKNPENNEEYTDQELLDLVNYFEVSRVELKNVRKLISVTKFE
jgi:hypothetical protein